MSCVLYVCMVAAGVTVHYLFAMFGALPVERPDVSDMVRFAVDHTFFLNAAFAVVAAALVLLHLRARKPHRSSHDSAVAPR